MVTERSGPGSPRSTARATSALRLGVPAPSASWGAVSTPSSSGEMRKWRRVPSRSSTTRVGAETLISSSPSSLDTTSALCPPSAPSAPATVSRKSWSATPIIWRVAPAGLVIGPTKLKIVRTASSLRTGTTWRMAAWWRGANMNPNPVRAMHSAIAGGSRSMRAPSASSRSADPDNPVAERLPCLATRQPAPAATSAAVVETLKVGRPPPVPAVSSRPVSPSPGTSTLRLRSRMVRASPVSSSTVSPLARRAMRKAAVWTSETRPSMTSRRTPAASSADRSRPEATRSTAAVRSGLDTAAASLGGLVAWREEVAQECAAVLGENRLRVELDPLGGKLTVAERHHRRVGTRRALEAIGKVGLDHQRVVACRDERGGEVAEDRPPVMLDRCRLAVHRIAAHDARPEGRGERLVAEAHAEDGHARLGEAADRRERYPGLGRRARPGRDHDALGRARKQLVGGRLVVADNLRLALELTKVLNEVPRERVVVVEDEHAHRR